MNTVLVALCLFVVAVAAETGIRERRLFFIKVSIFKRLVFDPPVNTHLSSAS
jgi:hypothetical protein